MAKPGYPTETYYPFVGWYFYRTGLTPALKQSRAHFWAGWGIFDPNVGAYPSISMGTGAFIFMDMSAQL